MGGEHFPHGVAGTCGDDQSGAGIRHPSKKGKGRIPNSSPRGALAITDQRSRAREHTATACNEARKQAFRRCLYHAR